MTEPRCVSKPCPKCPFRRGSLPGATGGRPPEVYIGQLHGPFMIPCHMHADYEGPGSTNMDQAQCAGAAVFRSNLGVIDRLPESLARKEPDRYVIFGTVEEFVSHHTGIPEEEIEVTPDLVDGLVREEIRKVTAGERYR